MILSARSSAGLEQQPSKLWVGGSSPSGQANCGHGGIGRHNRLKICRPWAVPVRIRVGAPTLLHCMRQYVYVQQHSREEALCPRRKQHPKDRLKPQRSSWPEVARSKRSHTVREVMIQHSLATDGERDAKRRKHHQNLQQNKGVAASNPTAACAAQRYNCTCCFRMRLTYQYTSTSKATKTHKNTVVTLCQHGGLRAAWATAVAAVTCILRSVHAA